MTDLINRIDSTTLDTNEKTTKLVDDILFLWKKSQEAEREYSKLNERTKELPSLLVKFYHMEKIVSKGNGSPSLIHTVGTLRDDKIKKTEEIDSLKEAMKKLIKDTESNSTFRYKLVGVTIAISVLVPMLIDKFF